MTTDSVLLRQYIDSGDSHAFAELMRRHAGLVFGTCLRITNNAHEAEDIAQECFLDFARKARLVTSSIPGWLHKVAHDRSVNSVRSDIQRRARETSAVEGKIAAAEPPSWGEVMKGIDEALDKLPENLRELILLNYIEGYRQEEIAEMLGINQSTVSRDIQVGIDKLRTHLKSAGIDVPATGFTAMLMANAVRVPPASLVASLNKFALAGIGSGKGGIAGGTFWAGATGMRIAAGALAVAVVVGGAILAKQKISNGKTAGNSAMAAGVGPLLGSPDFQPSPERPVGWRGDGSGRYPGATIPVEWGRRVKTDLDTIKTQANKPAEGSEKDLIPISIFGRLDEWLFLGCFLAGDMATAMDQEQIPGEADLSPSKGEATGGKTWVPAAQLANFEDSLCTFFRGVPVQIPGRHIVRYPYGEGSIGDEVAYAHTYVYAPTGMAVKGLVYQPFGSAKVWLNGKVVYNVTNVALDTKEKKGKWGGSMDLALSKGWNRILLKASKIRNGLTGKAEKDFRFGFQISCGTLDTQRYETKNIQWMTKLPQMMQVNGNASSPIVVGNRIFFMAEPADLMCFDKKTGKILWIRPNTFYDTFPESEKGRLSVARFEFVKVKGRMVAINSNRPLDPASAGNTESYQIEGVQLEKAELGNGGYTIRLTAKEAFKPGKEFTVKFAGLKTVDGSGTGVDEVRFQGARQWPVVAEEPVNDFLLSNPYSGREGEALKASAFKEEKDLVNPKAGGKWRYIHSDKGTIDLMDHYGRVGIYAYFHVYLNSDSDREVQLQLTRAGEDARVVVNGTLAQTFQVGRDLSSPRGPEKVDIQLKKGWNSLLICISNHTSMWALHVAFVVEDGKDLTGLSYSSDVPEAGAETMAWDEVAPSPLNDSGKACDAIKPLAEKRAALNDEIIREINAQVSPEGITHGKAYDTLNEKLRTKRQADEQVVEAMRRLGLKYSPRTQTWGNCSATPCTDGKRVYVWYQFGVAACYDLDGNLQWAIHHNRHAGTNYKHGDHSSPIIVDGKLIVYQIEKITAYDCRTGAIVWNHDTKLANCWSTPLFAKIGGENAIVVWYSTERKVAIYRVSDGTVMWLGRPNGVGEAHGTCSTPVINGDRIFNNEETGVFDFQLPDKSGSPLNPVALLKYDFTEPCMSPVYHDGIVYSLTYLGDLTTYDVEKHDWIYKESPKYFCRDGSRVEVPGVSPILAGKYIYLFDNSGTAIVLEPGRTYRPIARNQIMNFTQDSRLERIEHFVSCPVADGNNLYVRGSEYLYCIGEK